MRELLFGESDIRNAIHQMSEAIHQSITLPVVMLGIDEKGVILAQRLANYIKEKYGVDYQVGTLNIALFEQHETTEHYVAIGHSDISFSLRNKAVLIVSSQINTGKTIVAALNALFDYDEPAVVKCCCLLFKNNLTRPIAVDYMGLTITCDSQKQTDCLFYEADGEEGITSVKIPDPVLSDSTHEVKSVN